MMHGQYSNIVALFLGSSFPHHLSLVPRLISSFRTREEMSLGSYPGSFLYEKEPGYEATPPLVT